MNCWEYLGIAETQDIKAIKRAYAKQLKALDLDQDPEKFQSLKEAFEQAKQLAMVAPDLNSGKELSDLQGDFSFVEEPVPSSVQEVVDPVFSAEQFAREFKEFIAQGTYFDDVPAWRTFLNQYVATSLADFAIIQESLTTFTMENYGVLSLDVRKYLFDLAKLDEHPEGQKVLYYPDFPFDFYEEIPLEKRELYFKKRERLYAQYYNVRTLKNGATLLVECQALYGADPMLSLFAAYELLWQDFRLENEETVIIFKQLEQQFPATLESQFLSAYVSFLMDHHMGIHEGVDFPLADYKDMTFITPLFQLFFGEIFYCQDDKEQAQLFWPPVIYEMPNRFTQQEKNFVKKQVKLSLSERITGNPWLMGFVTVLLLGFIGKSSLMFANRPFEPRQNNSQTYLKEHPPEITIDRGALDQMQSAVQKNESILRGETSETEVTFEKDLTAFTANPNDPDPIGYTSIETGGFMATVPDFTHYNEADVKTILGEPAAVLEGSDPVSLKLNKEEPDLISNEYEKGNLTKNQGNAFITQVADAAFVATKVLVYDNDKPNVYLSDKNEVVYITPRVAYINFIGEK